MLQGYGVLVGSCFRSTPQIARIIRAGSARGVSLTASIAELIAYSITCAYNMRLGAPWSHRAPTSSCCRQPCLDCTSQWRWFCETIDNESGCTCSVCSKLRPHLQAHAGGSQCVKSVSVVQCPTFSGAAACRVRIQHIRGGGGVLGAGHRTGGPHRTAHAHGAQAAGGGRGRLCRVLLVAGVRAVQCGDAHGCGLEACCGPGSWGSNARLSHVISAKHVWPPGLPTPRCPSCRFRHHAPS